MEAKSVTQLHLAWQQLSLSLKRLLPLNQIEVYIFRNSFPPSLVNANLKFKRALTSAAKWYNCVRKIRFTREIQVISTTSMP